MTHPFPTAAEGKSALRKAVLARRGALDAGHRAAAALSMADHAMDWLSKTWLSKTWLSKTWLSKTWLPDLSLTPRIIAGYQAMRGEMDPAPLLAALAGAGQRIAMPRVDGEGLTFHAYRAGDPLEKGAFGIAEPLRTAPVLSPEIILAPLVAFDRRGHRLGYGKGYYDRVFEAYPRAVRLGLAFAQQEVERVPDEPHDRRLAAVITESGVIVTG